jgi:hypothetical protein
MGANLGDDDLVGRPAHANAAFGASCPTLAGANDALPEHLAKFCGALSESRE